MNKSCNLKNGQKLFLLHLNQAASCCRADPVPLTSQSIDYYLDLWDNEKQQLDHGVELDGCRHCWKAEHSGQQSFRQQMHSNQINNQVEIFISNLCNQMCSYCSPKFSSMWEENIQQHGNFIKVSKSAIDNLAINHIESSTDYWVEEISRFLNKGPVHLKLLGGEPLMQKRNLKRLLELNTDNIVKLDINTNLSPPNNKFLKWVLETFPSDKLFFSVSLDTLPKYNSIPRAGFNENQFDENLKLLKEYNVPFLFLSVVSVLNIFTISEYKNWLNDNNYRAVFSRLNNPDCLDPCYMPTHLKENIFDEFLPKPVKEALQYNPDHIDLKLFEQYNYLTQYFLRTNTTITEPNLLNYWNWLTEKFK